MKLQPDEKQLTITYPDGDGELHIAYTHEEYLKKFPSYGIRLEYASKEGESIRSALRRFAKDILDRVRDDI
jgi:hypothetical protein